MKDRENIEKMAEKEYPNDAFSNLGHGAKPLIGTEVSNKRKAFIKGYEKAQEEKLSCDGCNTNNDCKSEAVNYFCEGCTDRMYAANP